jgi:hypothetical protein
MLEDPCCYVIFSGFCGLVPVGVFWFPLFLGFAGIFLSFFFPILVSFLYTSYMLRGAITLFINFSAYL